MTGRRSAPLHGGRRATAVGITILLVVWWTLIAVASASALPSLGMSAPQARWLAVGERARIRQAGIRDWPIPTNRLAFDEFQRGSRESDEDAIDAAFAVAEWIPVNHGDAVRVVAIDGDVVEIELLEGRHAGRRAWVLRRHLDPFH